MRMPCCHSIPQFADIRETRTRKKGPPPSDGPRWELLQPIFVNAANDAMAGHDVEHGGLVTHLDDYGHGASGI